MKKNSLLRIAITILGSFLELFIIMGLIFSFGLKSLKVSLDAKSFVEGLGTRPVTDVLYDLALLSSKVPNEETKSPDIIDIPLGTVPEQTLPGETLPPETKNESVLEALVASLNADLDAGTVNNLSKEEQIEVHSLFANTIFFGDSMAQAIGEYGFMDLSNVVFQRSATIDVLIDKVPEVAATYPGQVIIFTGLNDCNHYTETAPYKEDYKKLIKALRDQIPGVKIVVTSLLSPSDTLAAQRPDLARAPIFDMELRSVCQSEGVTYIDSTWIVRQSNYLKDGIHMNRTFYRVWFRYLKAVLAN